MEDPKNNKKNWDILLMSEDLDIFQCHETVLKKSSLYFNKIIDKIKEATKDNENIVLFMSNCTSVDLRTIIKFIYDGEIQVQQVSKSLLELLEKYEIRNENGRQLIEILNVETGNNEILDEIKPVKQEIVNKQGSDTDNDEEVHKTNFNEHSISKQVTKNDDVSFSNFGQDKEIKENILNESFTSDEEYEEAEDHFPQNRETEDIVSDSKIKSTFPTNRNSTSNRENIDSTDPVLNAKEKTVLQLKKRINVSNRDAITPEKLWTKIADSELAIKSHKNHLTNEWESSIAFWEKRYISRNLIEIDSRNAVAQKVLQDLLDINLDYCDANLLNVQIVDIFEEIESSARFQYAASDPELAILQSSAIEYVKNVLKHRPINLICPDMLWIEITSSNITASKDFEKGVWLSKIQFNNTHSFGHRAQSETRARNGVAQKALEHLLGIHLNHWDFIRKEALPPVTLIKKSEPSQPTNSSPEPSYLANATKIDLIQNLKDQTEDYMKKIVKIKPKTEVTPAELWNSATKGCFPFLITTMYDKKLNQWQSTIKVQDKIFTQVSADRMESRHLVAQKAFKDLLNYRLEHWKPIKSSVHNLQINTLSNTTASQKVQQNNKNHDAFITEYRKKAERFFNNKKNESSSFKPTPLELLNVLWQTKVKIKTNKNNNGEYVSTIQLCDQTFTASDKSEQNARQAVAEALFRKLIGINKPYWKYYKEPSKPVNSKKTSLPQPTILPPKPRQINSTPDHSNKILNEYRERALKYLQETSKRNLLEILHASTKGDFTLTTTCKSVNEVQATLLIRGNRFKATHGSKRDSEIAVIITAFKTLFGINLETFETLKLPVWVQQAKSTNKMSCQNENSNSSSSTAELSDRLIEENEIEKWTEFVQNRLNQLNDHNLEHFVKELVDANYIKGRFQIFMKLVFEKAITDPKNSKLYALLSQKLHFAIIPETSDLQPITFRTMFLNYCQNEFEKFINKQRVDTLETRIEEERDEYRTCLLGFMRFLGELYHVQLLNEQIIHSIITQFFSDNDTLEYLCELLLTVGKELEKDQLVLDTYFEKLQVLMGAQETQLSGSVRDAIQKVIDLRKNKWNPNYLDSYIYKKPSEALPDTDINREDFKSFIDSTDSDCDSNNLAQQFIRETDVNCITSSFSESSSPQKGDIEPLILSNNTEILENKFPVCQTEVPAIGNGEFEREKNDFERENATDTEQILEKKGTNLVPKSINVETINNEVVNNKNSSGSKALDQLRNRIDDFLNKILKHRNIESVNPTEIWCAITNSRTGITSKNNRSTIIFDNKTFCSTAENKQISRHTVSQIALNDLLNYSLPHWNYSKAPPNKESSVQRDDATPNSEAIIEEITTSIAFQNGQRDLSISLYQNKMIEFLRELLKTKNLISITATELWKNIENDAIKIQTVKKNRRKYQSSINFCGQCYKFENSSEIKSKDDAAQFVIRNKLGIHLKHWNILTSTITTDKIEESKIDLNNDKIKEFSRRANEYLSKQLRKKYEKEITPLEVWYRATSGEKIIKTLNRSGVRESIIELCGQTFKAKHTDYKYSKQAVVAKVWKSILKTNYLSHWDAYIDGRSTHLSSSESEDDEFDVTSEVPCVSKHPDIDLTVLEVAKEKYLENVKELELKRQIKSNQPVAEQLSTESCVAKLKDLIDELQSQCKSIDSVPNSTIFEHIGLEFKLSFKYNKQDSDVNRIRSLTEQYILKKLCDLALCLEESDPFQN